MLRLFTLVLTLVVTVSALAEAVPPLWFKQLSGQRLRLPQLSSQSSSGVVVCVLWCSHCGSCRAVEDDVDNLCVEMRGRAEVEALQARVDDDKRSIAAYLGKHRRHFEVLQDPPGGLADRLNIGLTTTTVIFDDKGAIRYFGGWRSARAALEELLQGSPVSQPTSPFNGCAIRRPL